MLSFVDLQFISLEYTDKILTEILKRELNICRRYTLLCVVKFKVINDVPTQILRLNNLILKLNH